MSGHSHWAGIKHKKGATDAKRGKLFSKLTKYIMSAARDGGSDVSSNLKLRYAIDKAKAASMPKDTIERAVKKGAGELEGISFVEITYEGYASGGVAILVEVLTDNRNRTAAIIRKLFETRGGSLAGIGAVAWMFERKGYIIVKTDNADEDRLLELVIDAGAEDMTSADGQFEITCAVQDFENVRQALADAEIATDVAEIMQIPGSAVAVTEPAQAKRVLDLINQLEDNDDVQNVYANFDIPDALLDELLQ